ncbi:MAG TPA: diguanylate cyclase, partial [Longimicrobiales bacterium]|nr:diguanylate cyclase [Longimicrobiales bacterium]
MTAELTHALLVSGSDATLESLSAALDPASGFSVTRVGTAAEAARILDRERHDVVLLDLSRPDARGLGAAATAMARASGRPVIVVTDPADEVAVLKAAQGCADHLHTDELYPPLVRRSVRYAVDRYRSRRREQRAVQALRESEERYRGLFEESRDAIFMTEAGGEILEVNRATLDLLGYEEDELTGRDVLSVYDNPSDRVRFRTAIEANGHVRDFEVRLRRRDGSLLWAVISAWERRDPDGRTVGYQGIIHDISNRKETEDRLAHEAFHDALTDLPNRALFMDRLDRAVARRRRGEERDLAVLFLDLDRFKVVNDSMGHQYGDQLLRQMAEVLKAEVRTEDTVARLGGDEFAILLDGVDDASDPTHVAERIQERLREPLRLNGNRVFTSVSIGITFGGAGVKRAEDLLRDADMAMYRAKELGPARYQIFDQAMHAHAVTLLQLETDLRLALERQEFVLHYLPTLDTARNLLGFEALVRWEHPARGLLQPQA